MINVLPKKILISIGGFTGSNYKIEFNGRDLLYNHSEGRVIGFDEEVSLPTDKK